MGEGKVRREREGKRSTLYNLVGTSPDPWYGVHNRVLLRVWE